MKLNVSSLHPWFLAVLWLNVMDILLTKPAYESNPITLYLWGEIGILLSAWIKIGQVLFFGALILITKRLSTPSEWTCVKKLLLGVLLVLTIFYIIVVGWNTILFVSTGKQ
ncbi:MAG: hypothetical protein NWE78_06455 [Candidatus Bathyarchaeota archaeon]|nr:hypothetical protein [Candidatus Bathyarchaeota archaeon]